MASKQTRRSISVRGTTYTLLRDFCSEADRSMSDVVEELLSRILQSGESTRAAKKTVAPLLARAPRVEQTPAPRREVGREIDRAAFRVAPLPPAPTPAPVARVAPQRPVGSLTAPGNALGNAPARPVPVASAGRPAPTPAARVKGTQRNDYRAIRF